MLPTAKGYLHDGGLDPTSAAYATIGCFLGGVIGIQFLSRVLHHYIPSHVVDCDHSHDDGDDDTQDDDYRHNETHNHNGHVSHSNGFAREDTPLMAQSEPDLKPTSVSEETTQNPNAPFLMPPEARRPSLQSRLTSRMSTFVSGSKSSCIQGGPCYGYSDPCGRQCYKAISRSPTRAFGRFSNNGPSLQPSLLRTATTPYSRPHIERPNTFDEEFGQVASRRSFGRRKANAESEASARAVFRGREGGGERRPSHLDIEHSADGSTEGYKRAASVVSGDDSANDVSHHHHVPSNAFLAIGLQTSIAIALHKLPEGFITYATNHANPKLGFTVFMALFIHNITEGFAMALPLYLAIKSRWKAMFWSSLLGGVSQPLGAGVAALWFKVAGKGSAAPGDTVYGCMFSITAGIMASVALQLFSESLSLTHNRSLCTAFAFIGMGILGISFALTAE